MRVGKAANFGSVRCRSWPGRGWLRGGSVRPAKIASAETTWHGLRSERPRPRFHRSKEAPALPVCAPGFHGTAPRPPSPRPDAARVPAKPPRLRGPRSNRRRLRATAGSWARGPPFCFGQLLHIEHHAGELREILPGRAGRPRHFMPRYHRGFDSGRTVVALFGRLGVNADAMATANSARWR